MNLSRPKILTLRELQEQSNNKMQETYKIEKYKAQVELAVLELQEAFKEYEKSPEKHPMYSEEWKAYWSRVYKQLVSEGKDANSHDYKPDWFNFWTKRMDEIHKLGIDKKKESFRKKLGLSIDTISNIEASSQTSRSSKYLRNYETPSNSEDVVEISDDELIEPRKKRFRSGFSRERYCSEERFHSERTRKSPEDGPINLVSVCRLLSALESELGLMAKPVIDLLAKAVATEKSEPNSADNLLFDEDNLNILETVKEKLKGVLTANLISSNKVVAVKRAVQNIAILLHEVSLKTSTNGQKKSTSVDPATDAKMKIVEAIAENLASEGRANISEDELEALVESFLTESADVEEGAPVVKAVEIVTDEDLQTLLINFDELHGDEQSNLITYLAKIEQANPARAEKLRKYVNIGDADFEDEQEDTDRF